jgi:hypothetical protein
MKEPLSPDLTLFFIWHSLHCCDPYVPNKSDVIFNFKSLDCGLLTGVNNYKNYMQSTWLLFLKKRQFLIKLFRVNTRCIQVCCSAYGRYVVYLYNEFYAIKPRFPRECVSSSGLFPV